MPSIATNAASSDINKLAYMRLDAATIAWDGFSWMGGTVRFSPGRAVGFKVKRIARRRAADCSFESGSSFGWTPRMNAELTAENRPAYKNK